MRKRKTKHRIFAIALAVLLSNIFIQSPAKASTCDRPYLISSVANVKKLGTINVQVVFLRFPDSPKKSKGYIKQFINNIDIAEMKNYVKESSYGKAKLNLNIVNSWVNMPAASYSYGIQGMISEEEENNFRDAIVNSSKIKTNTDVIWAVPDPDFAPYYIAFRNPSNINGKNVMTVLYNQQNAWLAVSEIFHGLGLRDLYASVSGGPSGGMDQFSLMSQYYAGADLTGYEKYSLGWLGSKDTVCHESGSRTVKLNPLGAKGTKLVLVPINAEEMIAIEYRKKEKRDKYLGSTGILVYHINNQRNENSPMNPLFFGKKGSVDFQGINIKIKSNIVTVTR